MTHPPMVFSRESRIRIDAQGGVWHEGERVENPRLAEALASWITWEPESGRWILRNSLDWCYVAVDDTPMAVRSARVLDAGAVLAQRSDGVSESLPPSRLRIDPEGAVFAYVRDGSLLARFSRAAAFAVLDAVETAGDALFLRAGDARFPLHALAPGAVPPHVPPTATAPVPPTS
ncbi:MAG: hypothetical protein U0325_25835 [Polyangiales bacterium]